MNRGLVITLALVAGVSLYMGLSSDGDDILAPTKGGGASARKASANRAPGAQSHAARKEPDVPADVAARLSDGVRQWQARLLPADVASAPAPASLPYAWAGMSPPPPPPPPAPVTDAPPPPPRAPRFPHTWVGRFNDDAGPDTLQAKRLAAKTGASEPSASEDGEGASPPPAVVRAVITGPQSTWVVQAGDVIDGQWRIDRIQDRTMSLTYLPLQQQQTVVMR